MEADGDLAEPFDPDSAAEAVESEANPPQEEQQPSGDEQPPSDDSGTGDELAQPFDDSMGEDEMGSEEDTSDEEANQNEDKKLSEKANSILNQTLYQKIIGRNKEIEETLESIQQIIPVLPYDIVEKNDVSINRLKAALSKGQSYVLEKFVDCQYGENLLFYQKLDSLYTLLLDEVNKNLKKVKL
jgi:hypothetical protein